MANVVILAGPNGAGKTSAAPVILRDRLRVAEFVNADVIARGLSGFAADTAAVEAGRVMLRRLDQLAAAEVSFAFEATLSGTTFLRSIDRWPPMSGTFTTIRSAGVRPPRADRRVESTCAMRVLGARSRQWPVKWHVSKRFS